MIKKLSITSYINKTNTIENSEGIIEILFNLLECQCRCCSELPTITCPIKGGEVSIIIAGLFAVEQSDAPLQASTAIKCWFPSGRCA